MRYHYFYQTSKNESVNAWIDARDRNDAYTQLRKRRIKPYKLLGRNPIAWKRWAAIGILSGIVAVLSVIQLMSRVVLPQEEPRSQIYGEPAIMQRLAAKGWRITFCDSGDAWFARHAIPASVCDCPLDDVVLSTKPIAIGSDDSPELAKMKRMINGMKSELKAYLLARGSWKKSKLVK